jgi:hypothetical protein
MPEAPTRLGPAIRGFLQQAHKGSCAPQPCVVAVTPVAVQPPAKPARFVGTPMWRNRDRAKEILEKEAPALALAQERFNAWYAAKQTLVGALEKVGAEEGGVSKVSDWCCGGTSGRVREQEEEAPEDGGLIQMKQAWRACKDQEAAFECAWARTKTMNAELLDQLTLQSGNLLKIFTRCECEEHAEDREDEPARHDHQDAVGAFTK